ncbi:MAG: glycosyltransferase family 2 protein [bacterium]
MRTSTSPLLPRATIVVLNWNKALDTLACLASVSKLRYDNYDVIVVDNGSTDGSVAAIRDRYPDVTLLENPRNLGYAEGNNAGIRLATERGADFVFLLNNDARVVPDTLSALATAATAHADAAFLGPKIYHLDSPKQIQSAGGELDHLWRSRQRGLDEPDSGQYDAVEEVDYVIGAAVLARTDLLKEIGLLDPDFFLYREDVDWCLGARRLGYRILYVPEAEVWHRSHHIRETELPRITYYMTRNSLMLLTKHNGGVLRFAAVLLRHLLTAVTWTIKPRWQHKRVERNALLKGLVDFFRGKVGQGYV